MSGGILKSISFRAVDQLVCCYGVSYRIVPKGWSTATTEAVVLSAKSWFWCGLLPHLGVVVRRSRVNRRTENRYD